LTIVIVSTKPLHSDWLCEL